MPKSLPPSSGRVYLVGAGPGDPLLLTLRGAECLSLADLVFSDYLVNPLILGHMRPSAEVFFLGDCSQGRNLTQDEVHIRMIAAARQGRQVVRLKSGDPHVFGRASEECEALEQAGIEFEVVPGVTAAVAAAAYAGIPLTHGLCSSAVALVTGHERTAKPGPALDYGALAGFPGTLVFYMGVSSAEQWSQALLKCGKPPGTPVAVVQRVSWSDQQSLRTTLGELAQVVATRELLPPTVIVVGEVVQRAPVETWFTRRPLFGKRVLVTRPRAQAESLCRLLTQTGAEVLVQPVIEILPPDDWAAVDAALDRMEHYDWLVFSSSNGVRFLLERLLVRHGDIRALGQVKLAAIGPGTAEELARYHLRADLIPEEYRAEALAEALVARASGRKFLLARASRGREVLAEQLAAAGASVEQVVVYRSVDLAEPDPAIRRQLDAGRIDWITVTSSSIAQSLARWFGSRLRDVRLASISPVTSGVLRDLGLTPAAEAAQYTMEGVVDAIVEAVRRAG
jgi:uroporphyrinogen III methyltransferase / synthase